MPAISRSIRVAWKQASAVAKIKLLYTKVTLTRFTTIYFFLAVMNCVVLVALQGMTLANNAQVVDLSEELLNQVNASAHNTRLLVFIGEELQMCDGIPGQPEAQCHSIAKHEHKPSLSRLSRLKARRLRPHIVSRDDEESDESSSESDDTEVLAAVSTETASSSSQTGQGQSASSHSSDICSSTLLWFHGVVEDEKREDIATIFFHFWVLSLAIVTILNESLPHLIATLAAHILGTAWAGFRIHSAEKLKQRSYGLLAVGACLPEVSFNSWWGARKLHAIIIAVFSILILLATFYFSCMLYRVYTNRTFSRVGASPQVHKIYKLVLLLSASLQLAWFFSLTSSGIWIDKVSHGTLMHMSHHRKLYLAAFSITFILAFPWLVLGWISVRRENRKFFAVFGVISVILVGISSAMFGSVLYRYIFVSWPFFATVTVTAYIFTVATLVLGILCRLQFGKGLAHYLQVSDTLEGMDFTPVYFSSDAEKASPQFPVRFDGNQDEKYGSSPFDTVSQPQLSYQPTFAKTRGASIYTNASGDPIKLSSTPSLFRESGPRKSVASMASSRRGFDGPGLNMEAIEAYSRLRMPLKSVSPEVASRKPRSRDLTPSFGNRTASASTESPFAPLSRSTSPASTSVSESPTKKALPSNPRSQK